MEERIVIDANIGIALAVHLPYSNTAEQYMNAWSARRVRLFVPLLWEYECVTGLRRAVAFHLISEEESFLALERFERLGLRKVGPRVELHERSLFWAGKLGQAKAYDSQYLSLAEKLGAEFWTADERLRNAAGQAGARWVHWIGELR